MTLDDPELVAHEYATEAGLLARRSIYENTFYETSDGPLDLTFSTIGRLARRRVLEVGCGPGEMAERIARELSVAIVALDISPRMVELARARGVDALVGDVQDLPFPDESFDTALAAWVLYHVPDLDRGLGELERVLTPGGHLVAVTNSDRHLAEAAGLAGIDTRGRFSFCRENGEEILSRHFASVERHDIDGWITFSDRDAVQRCLDSRPGVCGRERVRDFEGELQVGARVTIFVAEKAG